MVILSKAGDSEGDPVEDGIRLADSFVMGDGIRLADSLVMGDGIRLADSLVMGDGIRLADSLVMGDGIRLADSFVMGERIRSLFARSVMGEWLCMGASNRLRDSMGGYWGLMLARWASTV